MDKYTLLLLLNIPFVVFGIIRALLMFKESIIQRVGLLIRFFFWTFILFGLVFAEEIYKFLSQNKLSDTDPLSLAEVLLATGFLFLVTLCIRIYTKTEELESQFTKLHEEISILHSKNK